MKMKCKKLIALLMTLVMLFCFVSCGADKDDADSENASDNEVVTQADDKEGESAEAEETESDDDKDTSTQEPDEEKYQPLLYKVTDENGNYIYLFGSIHVGREDFYPLPDYVLDAYEESEALAVEFDVVAATSNMMGMSDAMMDLIYTDGTTIKDHIDKKTYENAKQILKDEGLYMGETMDYFCPAMWWSLIDSALQLKTEYDSEDGIDVHLLNTAKDDGKKIIDIESMEFQFGMLAGFSAETQSWLLEDSVASYNEYKKDDFKSYDEELTALVDLWASGNEKEFNEYVNEVPEFESKEEERLWNEYNDAMLTDRNIGMADFAEEQLEDGKTVFICVGAAHIVGNGGVADLLEKAGYTVTLIK